MNMGKKKRKPTGPPPIAPIPKKDLLKSRALLVDIIDMSDGMIRKAQALMSMMVKQNNDRNSDNYAMLVTKRVDTIHKHAAMISRLGIAAINWSKIKNIDGM